MPASPGWKNKLFYGDNLKVLRRHREELPDETVDLVYLDPPFNSNASYNVLFAERDGTRAASQLRAFEDTWKWNTESSASFFETVEHGPERVSRALQSFRIVLGDTNMLAYLSMMAPRLVELRRVLKPTGSIYLHCDPTASHYLKVLMDAVFGAENFRNEIIWKRTFSHGNASSRFGNAHDVLLFYSKSAAPTWNQQHVAYSEKYLKTKYRHRDPDGRVYRLVSLRNPGVRPNLQYIYKGYKPHPNGWAITKEKMEQLERENRLRFPKSIDGRIELKQYLDEMPGTPVHDVWIDINPINSQAQERLGYPTQKPEALLERIIAASSNEGDLVLDPFCGCGTAIAAAHNLRRRWIGIDVTQAAIVVIKQQRLSKIKASTYEIIGEPESVPDAAALADQDPYQFQWWAVGLLDAHPIERKKGKDRGVDGRIDFHDDQRDTKHVIISVKGGQRVKPEYLRDLRGVMQREQGQIGVLVLRNKPTRDMRQEAASGGFYYSPWMDKKYPRLQILTIADLIAGERIEMPPPEVSANVTFRKGPKRQDRVAEQNRLFR